MVDAVEGISLYVAGLIYDEKRNMGISIIYTRMNIGGCIITVPYLDMFDFYFRFLFRSLTRRRCLQTLI